MILPKFFEKYPEYKIIGKPDADLESRYKPNETLKLIWEQLGFGIFMNGYLRIVNPADYQSLYEESFSGVKETDYVIATTAFGDLLTWVDGDLIELLDFRNERVEIINGDNVERFFERRLLDDSFINTALKAELYNAAVARLGVPGFDECFAFEPLLAAGGEEQVENLSIVKLAEHIAIVTQFIGPYSTSETNGIF
jgi:hypothetical protein